jgi:hypothetical protein
MSGHIDAERILDAFLAPEADRLADRVIDAALADIARTPQERGLRIPRRFTNMPASLRLAAAAAIVAVVGVGVLIYNARSPGIGAVPTPAPTPAWVPYTSARYGFEIAHPADWTVLPSERDWNENLDRAEWQSPATERFLAPDQSLLVTAFVDRVPNSVGLDMWLTHYCRKLDGCDIDATRSEKVMIDGHSGRLIYFPTDVQAFTIFRGTVYVIAAWRPTAGPTLQAFVASMQIPD